MPRPADAERDAYAGRILEYIVGYLRASGRRILPGETMACAWSTPRFEAAATPGSPIGTLAVDEMAAASA